MKVMAFNGSPRKKWNTAMLLEKAIDGAASQGAETSLIHLYDRVFNANEHLMQRIFGQSESIMSYDTYQFADYSMVVADRFDVDMKGKRRREVFPKDCQKVYDMGAALAKKTARE
jgi:hypothetical protein